METDKLVVGIVSREHVKVVNEELGIWAYLRGLTAQEYLDARTKQTDMFDISATTDGNIKLKPKNNLSLSMSDYVIYYGIKKQSEGSDPCWNICDSNNRLIAPTLENIVELYEEIHTWLFKEINDLSKLSKLESKNLRRPLP